MSEEMAADSGEVSEVNESTDSGMDMDAALETMSNDLFPNSEVDNQDEFELEQENDTDYEEPVAKEPEVEEPVVEARKAPQSWKKEMQETFAALPPEAQDYIEHREAQMKKGLDMDRDDANLGRTMRDTLQPYGQMLDHIKAQKGVEAPQVIQSMLNAHYQLSTSNPEQKQQLFAQLAQEYGVSLNGEAPKEVDPALQNVQNELSSIKQGLSQQQQERERVEAEKVTNDITAFAEDQAHPYFEEVSDQIVAFINAGDDLADAYEKAVWANPVTRQKELERSQQELANKAAEKSKQDVAKAKKASATNVKGRNTKKAPTAPTGSMDDTMREVYREIQSRH